MRISSNDGIPADARPGAPAHVRDSAKNEVVLNRLIRPIDRIPQANFSCANDWCAEQTSFPADMLYWWDGGDGMDRGFYCQEGGCMDGIFISEWEGRFPLRTLADVLAEAFADSGCLEILIGDDE